jgi:hypothetical protein
MKRFNVKNLLSACSFVWTITVIINYVFNLAPEKHDRFIIVWSIIVIGALIYNKLDKIEKSL